MQSLHDVRRSSLTLRVLPVAVALVAAMPATAQAQGCVGAPGASALEQYCEAVPRADGGRERPGSGSANSGSSSSNGSGSSNSGGSVSSSTAKELTAAGKDGAAVAALAGSASKETSAAGTKGTNGKATADAGEVKGIQVDGPDEPSGSPLKAATNAVASGPTAGGALVWGLVGISALGAAGAVFLRRGQRLGAPDDDDQS